MSASELYESLRLQTDSQNIRILDLHTSCTQSHTADTPQPLGGTLHVASLAERPRFAALSYVWGEESIDSPTILIGKHRVRITTNCYEALSSLVERYGAISIWVDSICIDQRNLGERSHQVALMGKIYGQAHTVFAWLGIGSDVISAAFSWLTDVAENKKRWDVKYFDEAKYLEELARNSWFSRGWTFQELILARNPVLFTRKDMLHWHTVSRATEVGPNRYLDYIMSFSNRNAPTTMYELASLSQTWKAAAIALYGHGFWLILLTNVGILSDVYIVLHRMDISWHEMFHEMPMWFLMLYIAVNVGRHIMYMIVGVFSSFLVYFSYLIIKLLTGKSTIPVWQLDTHLVRYLLMPAAGWRLTFIARFLSGVFAFYVLVGSRLLLYGSLLPWKTVAHMTIACFRNQSRPCGAIVQTLRNRQVRDIKDTSYALYGVLQAFGAKLARPDYTKSTSQVFYQLAVDLLQWTHNSLIFLLDAGQSEPAASPTWIPRWKDSAFIPWIPSSILLHGTNASLWEHLTSHGLPLHTIQDESLEVCAIFVDKVSQCIRFPENFEDEKLFPQLHAMIEPLRKRRFDYGVRMVGTDLPEHNRVRAEKELILWDGDVGTSAFIELLMKLAGCSDETLPQQEDHPSDRAAEFAKRLSACMADDTGDAQWFRYICNEIRSTSVLFVTESGHVGVGPLWMQPQDDVYRISGVPRPLVLRAQAGTESFKVVGVAVTSDEPKGFFWLRKMKRTRLI